jgi:hypothetical protein
MSQLLPPLPNLEHLKGQAKDALRVVRRRMPSWKLADAQQAVARGYGFSNWPELKAHVDSLRRRPSEAVAGHRPRIGRDSQRQRPLPIAGTWILDAATSTANGPASVPGCVMLEFAVTETAITMTQVLVTSSGNDIAVKLAVRADGTGPPVRFGNGYVLHARVADSDHLEAVITQGEQVVSRGMYEASDDGQTLAFVTSAMRMVFDRVGVR